MRPSRNLKLTALAILLATACLAVQSAWADSAAPSAGDDGLFKRLDADANGIVAADEVPAEHRRLFERLIRKADDNGDDVLSWREFSAALTPSRPEKTIETKQPQGNPGSAAIRYMLLSMDTTRDSSIEAEEVPEDLLSAFDDLVERVDMNKNGSLDRYELSRGARDIAQVSVRFVARERIDVAQELARLEKLQGDAANRFDEAPQPFLAQLKNPRQARSVFARVDQNKDGELELSEFPEPAQAQLERFFRIADRDRSGGLSEREFLFAAERANRMMAAERPKDPIKAAAKRDRKASKFKLPLDDSSPGEAMPAESMEAEE